MEQPDQVLDTVIHESIVRGEPTHLGKDIFSYATQSTWAADNYLLVAEYSPANSFVAQGQSLQILRCPSEPTLHKVTSERAFFDLIYDVKPVKKHLGTKITRII